VRDFDPTVRVGQGRQEDGSVHPLRLAASLMALDDSGLEITEANAERIGAIVGAGIGGIAASRNRPSPPRTRPAQDLAVLRAETIINMLPGQLSIMLGLKGRISRRCPRATSNHNIGVAMRMIQYGDADVMVAGGAELGSSPTAMGGFCSMKAMSTRNDEPAKASRPWDKDRDGFVLGDGAGILILEEYEHAKARGARIYCELVGFGMSSDAYHMTAPSETAKAPRAACRRSRTPASTPIRSATSTRTAPPRRWATWPRPWRSSVPSATTPTR
jgi:3-oxoacyl-[acyl-carrier-protein] synthase II